MAACVTATDPVLASSVVGKGKFAKRVPKHLRDLLSAESGCNDGMAFPFIYLALYLIHYRPDATSVAYHWIVITILYECVFGAIYGFTVGYIGRHGIKWAERHDLVDRESFLVFYFVLALFCAGSGSMIGVDDLLVGFAAGVGFSNDGWFTQKTEESHVSNVIDLLINLAYFVYFGTIIPWDQFNSPALGTTPWKLVVIAIFVLLFRRVPIMLALKPLIPDIKTWREALFAGHFGPIGVGALFVAILARADLETEGSTPLATLPPPGTENFVLLSVIWPITTFLVVSSILVHGSSIAVFTLGKHINTLTLTMSYTTAHEDGPSWMNRLPRIQSQSKSMARSQMSESESMDEKDHIPPGELPGIGLPGTFLRRQREEDNPSHNASRSSSIAARRRKKRWDDGLGPGGPISQSAIAPQRRSQSEHTSDKTLTPERSESSGKGELDEDELGSEAELGEIQDDSEMHEIMHRNDNEGKKDQHKSDAERHPEGREVYEEGDDLVVENEDGDVLSVQRSPEGEQKDAKRRHRNIDAATHDADDSEDGEQGVSEHRVHRSSEGEPKDEMKRPRNTDAAANDPDDNEDGEQGLSEHRYKHLRKKLGVWRHKNDDLIDERAGKTKAGERKRGPALAYQFGNTVSLSEGVPLSSLANRYRLSSKTKMVKSSRNTNCHLSRKLRRSPKLKANVVLSVKESTAWAPGPVSAAPPRHHKPRLKVNRARFVRASTAWVHGLVLQPNRIHLRRTRRPPTPRKLANLRRRRTMKTITASALRLVGQVVA